MRQIFCTRTTIDDYRRGEQIPQDVTVGLYNRSTTLVSDVLIGETLIAVNNAELLKSSDIIRIYDDAFPTGEILTISMVEGNTLHIATALTHNYASANAVIVAGSELRWAQGNTSPTVTAYRTGIFVEGGIGAWTKELEVRDGGATELAGNVTIQIDNTNQFQQWLQTKGIELSGLMIELLEWDATSGFTVRARMKIESINWTSTIYSISAKTDKNKRISYLSNSIAQVSDAATLLDMPVTIGTLDKAAAIMIEDSVHTYDIYSRNYVGGFGGTVFEVWPGTTGTTIKFISDNNNWAYYETAMVGHYIYVLDAKNSGLNGQYRFVSSGTITATPYEAGTYYVYTFVVDKYFSGTFTPRASWVEFGDRIMIADPVRTFKFDSWPLLIGQPVDGLAYVYDNIYNEIQTSAYSVDATNAIVTVNAEFYEGALMASQQIKPVSNLQPLAGADAIYKWWGNNTFFYYDYPYYGYYYQGELVTQAWDGHGENYAAVTDKNASTQFEVDVTVKNNAGAERIIVQGFTFTLPSIPVGIDPDNIYVIMDEEADAGGEAYGGATEAHIKARRIIPYMSDEILKTPTGIPPDDPSRHNWFKNVPTWYATNVTPTTDFNYYVTGISSGYSTWEIDKTDYNNYEQLLFFWYASLGWSGSGVSTRNFKMRELAILFYKSLNFDNLYSQLGGRTRNDAWGRGMVASDLLTHPRDVMEMICRLQAYPDTSKVPTNGWGSYYADFPLIRTSGIGGFDDDPVEMQQIDSLCLARQITSVSDSSTDSLKLELCREISCANFTDQDGNECFIRLVKPISNPTTTITLFDITDRAKIDVKDLMPNEIFCEPVMKYGYDYASKEYREQIAVTNSSAISYVTGYVTGCSSNAVAEEIWDLAHALWLKCRQLNEAPSSLTDLKWADGTGTTGRDIAERRLLDWLSWQGNKFVTIPLHYNMVKDWELCQVFDLSLPNINEGIEVRCMATKITYDPNPPFECIVEAVMYVYVE